MTEPIILAIESSGTICSISLTERNKLIAEYSAYITNSHDRLLSEYVNRILPDFNLKITDIHAVAVSAGPGSFTGLRIGAALAKGLCFGNSPKFIAVPTLEAVAEQACNLTNCSFYDQIVVAIPSHKDNIYIQTFNTDSSPLTEVLTSTMDVLNSFNAEKTLFLCQQNLKPQDSRWLNISEILNASTIARKAVSLYLNSTFTDAKSFTPTYILDFVPKEV
ncbi:MAG: tRNA (adenosine(37)-N6)-threonylcarbamoyltransferase complex dimerization subunit type 1 TsaB [Candidatus Kapabacteria bacterium]|nr:tRNA (adenosine(37)-N6)-threonylcarbamoyltransferase complex dimerization subunit type 1 TsaB [Candidatus Kapabacteria bacterium]